MKTNGKHEVIARIARRGLVFAALLAMALSTASLSRAQSNPTPPSAAAQKHMPPPAKPAASPAEETPARGKQEGIKVHGYWTIEVRNPDGSVVSHTEFENSYLGGSGVLPCMLSRCGTFGEWGIVLGNSVASQSPCVAQITAPFSLEGVTNNQIATPLCVISESGPSIGAQNVGGTSCTPTAGSCSQNLQVGNAGLAATLSGSVLATNSGTINQVETLISECLPSLSSTACATETVADSSSDNVLGFTFATLPPAGSGNCGGANQPSCAVNVIAQQTIGVTVAISFQ